METPSTIASQVFDLISSFMSEELIKNCVEGLLNGVSPLPKPAMTQILHVLRKNKVVIMLMRLTIDLVTDDPKIQTEPRFTMEERLKLSKEAAISFGLAQ